jgi:hypothetical protein
MARLAWVYPPDFPPKHVAFKIKPVAGNFLDVDIAGGLIRDRDSESENYGAYFICNNRLVVKEHGCLTPALFTSAEPKRSRLNIGDFPTRLAPRLYLCTGYEPRPIRPAGFSPVSTPLWSAASASRNALRFESLAISANPRYIKSYA